MSDNNQKNLAYLIMKGVISELPEDSQKVIYALAEQIEHIVKTNGDYGKIALALIGTKYQEIE